MSSNGQPRRVDNSRPNVDLPDARYPIRTIFMCQPSRICPIKPASESALGKERPLAAQSEWQSQIVSNVRTGVGWR